MSATASASELERFRALIGERLGLWLDDTKLPELSGLLARRVADSRLAPSDYLLLVDDGPRGGGERSALARALTVGETYFFRQSEQLAALLDHAAERSAPLRVLSLGCASGEEPYSIAITLRERLPAAAEAASIRAIDVNPSMIERARAGRYSSWALRETPEATARRWFGRDGAGAFVLDDAIKKAVAFEERNLVEPCSDLLAPASSDAIFFRNVLMYFTPRAASEIIARIAEALVPGGLLFLGYAETLRGVSTAFHLRHARETFYYQKRGVRATGAREHLPGAGAPADDEAAEPGHASVPWLDAIGRATERIRQLAKGHAEPREPASHHGHHKHHEHHGIMPTSPGSTAAPGGAPGAEAKPDLDPAFELLRRERFGDALAALRALPRSAAEDPDALLLHGALLVHSGELEAARRACSRLLERDELNAGAHYLLALVCEGEHDASSAAEHDRIAAYLDPAFAMPRLHLGLLARRKGDLLAARRELRQAYALLEREETARLVLFAGGFERGALLALCRAELTACGAAP